MRIKREKPKEKEKEVAGKLQDSEVGKNIAFNDGHEEHHLWIVTKGNDVELMVASAKPDSVEKKLMEWKKIKEAEDADSDLKNADIDSAEALHKSIKSSAKKANELITKAKEKHTEALVKEAENADNKVETDEEKLVKLLKVLFSKFSEIDKQKASSKRYWFTYRTKRPEGHLEYADPAHNNYKMGGIHGHHVWPKKWWGYDGKNDLMNVIGNLHLQEIHATGGLETFMAGKGHEFKNTKDASKTFAKIIVANESMMNKVINDIRNYYLNLKNNSAGLNGEMPESVFSTGINKAVQYLINNSELKN